MGCSLLTTPLKVPNVGRPSSWPGQLGTIIWTVLAMQRQQENSSMHETKAHTRVDTVLVSLFCLFYLLRAALVMFLFTILHRVRVGRQGQRTYELTLWKDGVTYGAHHVSWVIRLIANAFWMHPDVQVQLWKSSNNENVQTHIEEFQSGIFDMIITKHMLFFEVMGITNM